jgi:2'-hydroxyisoflavone reductase
MSKRNSRRDLTRRDVVRGGIAATALGLVSAACKDKRPAPATPPPPRPEPVKKRILILGGTGFLGPKTIDAAIARGHDVTIFNRGKREKFLPLEHDVTHLYGNRDPDLPADDEKGPDGKVLRPEGSPKGLEQLIGRQWDAVIDNSGYFPRHVKASAELLAPNVGQYIFISSISAYDEGSIPAANGDETVKLATLADPTVETMGDQFQNYGGLKVLCEKAAQAAFPGKATIVRPGYIVGPGDPTDRFTYWPVKIARGGEQLAPGSPDDPLQWIDVRDLGEWLVKLVEDGTAGEFNAVGPSKPAKWGNVLETMVSVSGSDAKLEWIPARWLEENGAGGEDAFPIWTPPEGKYTGFHRWNPARSEGAGLRFRPLEDTVKGILDWYPKEIERRVRVTGEMIEAAKAKGAEPPKGPPPDKLRAGPAPEREQELLATWHASKGGATKPATK